MRICKLAAGCHPATRYMVVIAIGVALALAAATGEAAFSKRVQAACKNDYKRLCPAYKANSLQLRACMEARASEISSRCIDALIDSGEVNKTRVKR